MDAVHINLSEWEYWGEGGSSTSYVKKMDGNVVLKLNNRDIPPKTTEKEYLASKAFNEAGFPSPEVYDFVTDGQRFGYTSRRIKGKMSYARMLSQEPDGVESLASAFAALAVKLHGTPADVSRMSDARADLLSAMGDLSYLPRDVSESVMKCFPSITDDRACLHGDLNPGNLITFEGQDKWIGVNEFAYGDPYLDIATLHVICHFLPPKRVKELYHVGQRRLRQFYTAFKKAYFGEEWNSREVNIHIHDASIVKFCAMSAVKPEYAAILVPLVRGQSLIFLLRRCSCR